MGFPPHFIDHERVAKDVIRKLRGRRSQNGLSRRLGYRSNVVHRWESGASWPTAARFLDACERLGIDVAQTYSQFFQRRPAWLSDHSPSDPAAVAAFLSDLRGRNPIGRLADKAGLSRFTVSRFLKGTAQPNLPQYFALIDAASERLPDYVGAFVDPQSLPSLRALGRKLELMRKLAYDEPWSHAVLRALQLSSCPTGCDVPTLQDRLGLERAELERLLQFLHESGQVQRADDRWRAVPLHRVDTGATDARARELKARWTRVALARLESGAPGVFGYSLFEVSRVDLERLRTLQLEYTRAMQAIIASSEHTECVGLYCAQLLDLAAPANNALG